MADVFVWKYNHGFQKYLWRCSYLPVLRISTGLTHWEVNCRGTWYAACGLNVWSQMSSSRTHMHGQKAFVMFPCLMGERSDGEKSHETRSLQELSLDSIPMDGCLLPASCPVVMVIVWTASKLGVYKYQQKQRRVSASPFTSYHAS